MLWPSLDQELESRKLVSTISVTAPENVIHITECEEGNGHNVKENQSIMIHKCFIQYFRWNH